MNREIEQKFRVYGFTSLLEVLEIAREALKSLVRLDRSDIIQGMDSDKYWIMDESSTIRLRRKSDGQCELTVKDKDQSDNINRLEVNVPTNDYDSADLFMFLTQGPCKGELSKHYAKVKFWDGGEIAVYKVVGQHQIFLEVETKDRKTLQKQVKALKRSFEPGDLREEPKSMCEIYIKG